MILTIKLQLSPEFRPIFAGILVSSGSFQVGFAVVEREKHTIIHRLWDVHRIRRPSPRLLKASVRIL